jgi:hypothetical protein
LQCDFSVRLGQARSPGELARITECDILQVVLKNFWQGAMDVKFLVHMGNGWFPQEAREDWELQ